MSAKGAVLQDRLLAFDLARGVAIICMVINHVFMFLSSTELQQYPTVLRICLACRILDAPTFMFLMGIGLAFSTPRPVRYSVRRGLILVAKGYLLNFLVSSLPEWLNIGDDEEDEEVDPMQDFLLLDVLHFSGIAVILLGVLRNLSQSPLIWAATGAIALAFTRPLGGNAVSWDLLMWPSVVGDQYIKNSFPLIPWLLHPIFGMVYGNCFRRVTDKRTFMLYTAIIGAFIAVLFLPDAKRLDVRNEDWYPSFLITSTGTIWLIGLRCVLLWTCNVIVEYVPDNCVFRTLYFWSKNVTRFYFIHFIIIGWLFVDDQALWQSVALIILITAATDFVIRNRDKRGSVNMRSNTRQSRCDKNAYIEYATGKTCLHHLFENWVDRDADAPAIIAEDRVLSYRDVDMLANRLARIIWRRCSWNRSCLKTEITVGIYLSRSTEAVVAIMAVLKAGAAYVPIDPSTTPIARADYIARSASISALITTLDLKESACQIFSDPIVMKLGIPTENTSAETFRRLSGHETEVSPQSLCYIIYTSGSTGTPKGVMIEHRNIVSFVQAFNQVVKIQCSDRVFQGFALGFDGSVEEMWMAFSNGAALVVEKQGEKRVGDELANWLNDMHVTVHSTVPTALSLFGTVDLANLRLLILSGEPCTPKLVQKWATPGRRLLNVYGPTEATVNTTCVECQPNEKVTIGVPLECYKLLILDENHRSVNVGEKGELFISGPTIARGYLNAPELTAKSFVWLTPASSIKDSVFALSEGENGNTDLHMERYYRTGDVVRRLDESGQLGFLGRIDGQVKIRGYRVELTEIEAVASEEPSVRRAVAVIVRRGEETPSSIALYVTCRGHVDSVALKEKLKQKLPGYMVPTYLEELLQFPTLLSGKVDRSKLPAPSKLLYQVAGSSASSLSSSYMPCSAVEQRVAQAFKIILDLPNLPLMTDCFFTSLGGDSFTAAQVVHHIREEFGYELSIRDIYNAPTVHEISTTIEKRSRQHAKTRLVESEPEKIDAAFQPCAVSGFGRFMCHFFQALALVVLYGVLGVTYLIPVVTGVYLVLEVAFHHQFSLELVWLVLIMSLMQPLMMLASVAVKWTVIGRYKKGIYPLWGAYYFRFWFVDRFQQVVASGSGFAGTPWMWGSDFAGTPWMSLYYCLMGAKVGQRCVLDTSSCCCFDLVSIGDDTSIGSETQLLGYRIEDGLLKVGHVNVGSRVFVGIQCCLGLNTDIGDNAKIDDLTAIHDEQHIGSGMEVRGSPAEQASTTVPPAGEKATRAKVLLYYLAHWCVWQCVNITTFVAAVPSFVLFAWMLFPERLTLRLLVLPALPVIEVTFASCVYAAFCRALAPDASTRVYSVHSLRYLQRWYVDAIMSLTRTYLRPLYTTIYCPSWLRLMGAQIGDWAEISIVSWVSPDLTVLGPESFFADGSIIGGRRIYCGTIMSTAVTIGRSSFVGNSAIVPTGSTVGNNCLLGVMSAPPEPPTIVSEGSEWVGNPAFRLLHRNKVKGFGLHETYRPTPKLIRQRLVIDFFRIWVPGMIQSIGFISEVELLLLAYKFHGTTWAVSFSVPIVVTVQVISLLSVVALKRGLIRRFEPTIQPLWSMFVWINELINGAYETIMAPILVPMLGSPFCIPPLRWMGCNIGKRCWIGTTLFSEFDLVNIGSDTVLNTDVVVQNHLFEDRIMKASRLSIGDRCNIGNMSLVLYDSKIGNDSTISALSLVMKGETIPPGGKFAGIPVHRFVKQKLTKPD